MIVEYGERLYLLEDFSIERVHIAYECTILLFRISLASKTTLDSRHTIECDGRRGTLSFLTKVG